MITKLEKLILTPGNLDISEGKPLNQLAQAIYDWGVRKGWSQDVDLAEKMLLIHSEVSEAFEHYRNHLSFEDLVYDGDKPDGIAVELIDAVIRIFHLLAAKGVDVDEIMNIKMEYNESRPYRHGNKKA